jgi:chitin disaccharide deacetylase
LTRRCLIVNADDFGFTRDVNAGIVEAHRRGILTAATLMANGAAFDDAVRLAEQHPTLDIGCHLVLVQGESVAMAGKPLPRTLPELFGALAAGRLNPYEEFRAQIEKLLEAGIAVSHLDTHKHTHIHPRVLDAILRVAREFQAPWVRRPFDIPVGVMGGWRRRLLARGLAVAQRRFDPLLARHGCRATDYFAGFSLTGRFRTAELVELIGRLPEGTGELMCHPGHCGEELLRAATRLKQSRAAELEALCAPETRTAIEQAGIRLVDYRQASAG